MSSLVILSNFYLFPFFFTIFLNICFKKKVIKFLLLLLFSKNNYISMCLCLSFRSWAAKCTDINDSIVNQIHKWTGDKNCPDGQGEKCLYTVC